MKTKISTALISLLLIMACQTVTKTKNGEVGVSEKIVLLAYNNMYVVVDKDNDVIANQPDAEKAEVFEKIDQGNGKWALKTSTGKFLSDAQGKNHLLIAVTKKVGATEQFEIIPSANSDYQISIKSHTGKVVCVDGGLGNKLIANRDAANTWETFMIESR